MIVVDTNVVAALWLGTDRAPLSEALLRADPEWVAPLLWRSEFRNVLAGAMRRGQLDTRAAQRLAGEAEAQLRGGEYTVDGAHVLALVARSRCTAYDCEFVALAEDLGVLVATGDRQVLDAFPGIARSPEDLLG